MKMKRYVIAVVVAAVLGAAQPKNPEAALGAARHMEEADGNYPGAIEAYKKFLAQYGKDRALAAKALVRMGQCYDKLGDAEARKAYERVVREFGDQKEPVEEAQKHLGAKGRGQESGVVARLIENANGSYGAAISRDGRYVTNANFGGPNTPQQIRLHDLVTGEVRVLVSGDRQDGIFNTSLISPDGKQVAYVRSGRGVNTVYVVGTDGSAPRLLLKGGDLHAWSPDGKYLIGVLSEPRKPAPRVLIPVAGGAPTVIAAGAGFARFTPDGRRFAFVKARTPGGKNTDIFVQSVDGGGATPLIENFGASKSPLFTPDGKQMLFLSDQAGGQDLWSLPLDAGAPAGPPVLLKQQVRALLGMTEAGECYYETMFLRSTLYVAGFDNATGKLTSRPKPVTDRDFNMRGQWSPDGQYFSYVSEEVVSPHFEIRFNVRSTKTGEERVVSPKDPILMNESEPHWFPDSRSVLIRASNNKLYQLDVRTSDVKPLLTSVDFSASYPLTLAPDGHTLYYGTDNKNAPVTPVFKRDLDGSAEIEICRLKGHIAMYGGFSFSPDASHILMSVMDNGKESNDRTFRLVAVPTSGGEPKELYKASGPGIYDPIWSNDGRWIIFSRQNGDVYSMPAEGGEPQALGIGPMHYLYVNRMHPDGKQIVMTDEDGGRQLWVLKGAFGKPLTVK